MQKLIHDAESLQGGVHPVVPRETAITKIQTRLWERIVQPVLQELPEDTELAVLLPGGLLGTLPLHAAGMCLEDDDPREWKLALESTAFTYAPNVAALREARRRRIGNAVRSALFVCPPEDDPGKAWLFSAGEHAAAERLRANGVSIPSVRPEHLTQRDLLRALSGHELLHFSGHTAVCPDAPLDSGLYLGLDEYLDVRVLLEQTPVTADGAAHLRRPVVAVLSSCASGAIGTPLSDEAVGLPTALLQAGFADVVSTQWRVFSSTVGPLMERFYELWCPEQGDVHPAVALARAQLDMLRGHDGSPMHPFDWAPFTHTGG
ncbi:CHAT domain-containing protein [Kitasatospora purpeofusca]|uniref:CHAT domain-containing protein n=1 Tax=Kitasatospora purpeofusca TaxID=67352 RepID=UPI003689F481